ncbi:hypothetical protein CLOSTMETH_00316 [[Clostridium] methylpentosum DSM 5476]|uniref:Uncharacterized protein n=1 Tax=[Clostridium] methylpentosum DSM 5476 TaxID=537013 RepID=C0E921_9FIRM|nr:hypothetical protein CLOSTMETH_00316 [[Clostridium] methylpentosum DSM 5476]
MTGCGLVPKRPHKQLLTLYQITILISTTLLKKILTFPKFELWHQSCAKLSRQIYQ